MLNENREKIKCTKQRNKKHEYRLVCAYVCNIMAVTSEVFNFDVHQAEQLEEKKRVEGDAQREELRRSVIKNIMSVLL